MYSAVSVWMTKVTKLSARKKAAMVYFFLVAAEPSVSGLTLWNVDLLTPVPGRALPFGAS